MKDAAIPPLSSNEPFFPELDTAAELSLFDASFGALDSSSMLSMGTDGFKPSHPTNDPLSLPVGPSQNLLSYPNNYPDRTRSYAGDSALNEVDLAFPSSESFMSASSETRPGSEEPGLASSLSPFPTVPTAPPLGAAWHGTGFQQPDSLETALRLMQQLSSGEDDPLFPNLTTNGPDHPVTELSQLPIVIDKNRKAMEAVRSTLQTTNSHDGYLLVVVCLVVSKVLNTYESTVRVSSAQENDRRGSGTSTPLTSSEKKDPIAAQRVLDELYQVQASMDQLGAGMQLWARHNRTSGIEAFPIGNDTSPTTLAGFPFSATILNQLYTEVRKRLSTLSLELIDELRRYWT